MEKNNNLSLGADMWKGSDIYDSFSDDTLQKAKELPDGSKSNHGGQPVVKQNGKWIPDTEGKSPKKEDTGDKEGSKSDDQSSGFTVGDTVKISAGIQSDPAGMKGQTVEVTKIDGDILHVKNSEGKTGMYMDNTASKVESKGDKKDEKSIGDKIEEVLEFDPNATDKQIADQLNISEKEIKEYLEGEDDKEYDKFVKKKEAESAKREEEKSKGFSRGDKVSFTVDGKSIEGEVTASFKDERTVDVKGTDGEKYSSIDYTDLTKKSPGETKEVTPDSINKELDSKKTTGSLTGQEVRKIISNSLPYSKDEMRDLKFTKASFDKEKRVEQIFITDHMSKEPESTGRYLEQELGSTEFLQKIQDTLPSGWKIAVPDKVTDSKGEYFGRGGKLHEIKVVNTNHPDYQSEGISGYGPTENFTKFVDGTEIASKTK